MDVVKNTKTDQDSTGREIPSKLPERKKTLEYVLVPVDSSYYNKCEKSMMKYLAKNRKLTLLN